MCGIAGVVDFSSRPIQPEMIDAMANAIEHRGPDEHGRHINCQVGLASRRLAIIDIEGGQQPYYNEDRSVVAVFNGELFDYGKTRADLEARGHRFNSNCDGENLPHLWEEYGEQMFDHIEGQFAIALYDANTKILVLARDRVGISPLHWTYQNQRLYFASEMKGIFASGEVTPEPDLRGIDSIFSMFALPARRTCFKNISSVLAGTYLTIRAGEGVASPDIKERTYWDLDFPDSGDENRARSFDEAVEGFREVLLDSVRKRLVSDAPLAAYLSGGVDSALITATASRLRDEPVHSFSLKIDSAFFDEEDAAKANADVIGGRHTIVPCRPQDMLDNYINLIRAAENPVTDTSCAANHTLAAAVRQEGYKVTLTGEGADEAFGSYPWFRINKLLNMFDVGGVTPSEISRWIAWKTCVPSLQADDRNRIRQLLGPNTAQADFYALVSATRRELFSPDALQEIGDSSPFEDLDLDHDRIGRWHPLNRSIYIGYKTLLSGSLLSQKSDRVAMASSLEARFPYLDEDLIRYCTDVPPEWKLSGIMGDKYLLRKAAEKSLPPSVARRPKKMFRAPLGDTLFPERAGIVDQLLSVESLQKTGYFNVDGVRRAVRMSEGWQMPNRRPFRDIGLVAVFATQLWHHVFLGGDLCELPATRPESGL